jgi:hypothetical protein
MSKTHSEIRFDKARKKLSDAFKNLEDVMKQKLHEAAIQSTMIRASEHDVGGRQAQIVEQLATIQSLNLEINNLQKNLINAGNETDFLNEKNKLLADKFAKLQKESLCFIETIETDITLIEEVMQNHDS